MTTWRETTKLTPFAGTDEVAQKSGFRLSAIFLSNPDGRCRYLWHLPNRNAPVGRPKKLRCGQTAILRHRREAFPGVRLPARGRFANRREQDIIGGEGKIFFFFLYF